MVRIETRVVYLSFRTFMKLMTLLTPALILRRRSPPQTSPPPSCSWSRCSCSSRRSCSFSLRSCSSCFWSRSSCFWSHRSCSSLRSCSWVMGSCSLCCCSRFHGLGGCCGWDWLMESNKFYFSFLRLISSKTIIIVIQSICLVFTTLTGS